MEEKLSRSEAAAEAARMDSEEVLQSLATSLTLALDVTLALAPALAVKP